MFFASSAFILRDSASLFLLRSTATLLTIVLVLEESAFCLRLNAPRCFIVCVVLLIGMCGSALSCSSNVVLFAGIAMLLFVLVSFSVPSRLVR
jgi:hypothetical protein